MGSVMPRSLARVYKVFPLLAIALAACGSDGGVSSVATVPSVPSFLGVTLTEQTVEMSWNIPDSDGGAPVQSYLVTIAKLTPATGVAASVVTNQTSTVIEIDLQEGVQYSMSVAAQNAVGTGPAASSKITMGTMAASFTPLTIQDDPGLLVQNVGIRRARSDAGESTLRLASITIAPEPATVTETDQRMLACGALRCSGKWVYETPWVVEDRNDPDPTRRFKLFAYKYFLNPSQSTPSERHLGAIVMWTASTLDAQWYGPASVLGSNLTPPELTPTNLVNVLQPDLAACTTAALVGAAAEQEALELVLTCTYQSVSPVLSQQQKVMLLRTTDHAQTFQYVSTLLSQADAKLRIHAADRGIIPQ
jgi:Fibronectin type III domain